MYEPTSSTDVAVVCSECGAGNFRPTGNREQSATCTNCGKVVALPDFEDAWYCYRRNIVLAYSERSQEVRDAFKETFGIELTSWDMAGGCFALAATLPDGREVYVNNSDAGLPDDERVMADHGGSLFFAVCWPEEHADHANHGPDGYDHEWGGEDIEALIEHAKTVLPTR